MSGYPIDTGSSFYRDPGRYRHDTFGHDGSDGCIRKMPHTGIDVSSKHPPTNKALQRTTPVLSPVYGTIVRTGFNKYAGNFHIIHAYGRSEFWIGGHHSRFERTSGNVDRGTVIARMGDTGGAAGVHTHWTVAPSLEAANAYIDGYVQQRNGRSVAAWQQAAIRHNGRLYGLLDPWPLIEREWAAHVEHLANVGAAAAAASAAAATAAALAEAEAEARKIEAAKARAEAEARENNMKTRLVRTGGDILVVNVADDFLWHVPNTKALPAAYVMADDPEIHELDKVATAALFDALANGRNQTKIASLRTKYTS